MADTKEEGTSVDPEPNNTKSAKQPELQPDGGGDSDKKKADSASAEKVNKENVDNKADIDKGVDKEIDIKLPDPHAIDRTDRTALEGESREKSLNVTSNLSELPINNQISTHSDDTAADSSQSAPKGESKCIGQTPELMQMSSDSISEGENTRTPKSKPSEMESKSSEMVESLSAESKSEINDTFTAELKQPAVVESLPAVSKLSEKVETLPTESKASDMVESSKSKPSTVVKTLPTESKPSEKVETLPVESISDVVETSESKSSAVVPTLPAESKSSEKVETLPKESKSSDMVESSEPKSSAAVPTLPKESKSSEKVETSPKESKSSDMVESSESKSSAVVPTLPAKSKSSEKVETLPKESKSFDMVESSESKPSAVVETLPTESKPSEKVETLPAESKSDMVTSSELKPPAMVENFATEIKSSEKVDNLTAESKASKDNQPNSSNETNKVCEKVDNRSIEKAVEISPPDLKNKTVSAAQDKGKTKVPKGDEKSKIESDLKKDHSKVELSPEPDDNKIESSEEMDKSKEEPIQNIAKEKDVLSGVEDGTENKIPIKVEVEGNVHDETSDAVAVSNVKTKSESIGCSVTKEKQVFTIVEQVDDTADEKSNKSKTKDKVHASDTNKKDEKMNKPKTEDKDASRTVKKDPNANNNARDVDADECSGKETDFGKESVKPEEKKSDELKQLDSGAKTQQKGVDRKLKADRGDDNKQEERKHVKEETKPFIKDKKEEGRKDVRDTRDRPSKSYSAQRTANRSSRRGTMEDDGSKTAENRLKDDRRNRVERERDRDLDKHREKDRERGIGKDRDHEDRIRDRDRDRDNRDRDRNRDAKGRDRGSQKESESEKSKIRDERREPRDRKSTPPTQESRRAKTREEREQEEQERRKRDEERRKKREEERKQLEEDKKKREEEKKRAEEERKQKEEEEKRLEEERKAEEERKRQEEEQKRLEEEAARLKEEEEKHAREISVEAVERKVAKMELRRKNLTASENRPDESFFTKLDSSLKKNTAFVKKLKAMSESQRLSLTKEFNTLNLTKYVGEVATSIAEAKMKMNDIGCAIHMCCLVHQRYVEFSSHLLQAILKTLPALPSKKDKDKDEQKPPIVFDSKIRIELRFLAELIVAGIFTEKEGLPVLNGVLSVILNSDKETHSNLPIIISFTKHCGEDFAGCVPRKNRIIAEKFGLTLPTSEVFTPEVKKAYTNLLRSHYASVSKYLVKKHKDFQKLERQNLKMLQTKGELSDDRKKLYEETQSLYQKLLMNTSTLSDLIDEEMPDLPVDEKLQEENELMAMDFLRADGSGAEFDFETSLWEDEDTKTFHENLIDLRTMVPAILFKGSEKRTAPGDKSEEDLDKYDEDIQAMEVGELTEGETTDPEGEDEGKTTAEEGETESGEPETEEPDDDDDEEEGPTTSNVSMKVMLDAFIQRLPECVNRDFIDKAAVDFCMNLNTKANRKKLVKALFNVPRTRLDLLSFYSRLVATLYPCMPDIATDLVEKLKQEFRWHMRKKDQMKIESKIKIVRFLGELTKFKMCPKADTLHALKQLLLVFHHHHIDMACNLLDECGRYLYRSKDSHLRTKALLDVMMRKRNKVHMNERHSTMVENAFYYCNPPESKQMEQKVRPPLHEYIRKLLFKDLTKITVEKVLKQMRKLPWNDLEIRQYAVKCLSSVWNVKFNNVHCMANLLAGLVLYHDYVGIQVVDAVLEDVRIGMEINYPKFNQRRVSVVKYLGELYNYRMVESSVIFKTLYSFIRFGITLDANIPSPLDPPEHLFRVRLTVTLLDTCGQFFDRGTSKKKLDCFLVYFQQYILFKRGLEIWNKETRPFPLDVDNAIADTFDSIRPKLKMFTTIEEANDAVQEQEKEYKEKLGDLINLTRVTPQSQGSLSTISESEENNTGITNGRRLSFVTGTEDEEESDSDMDLDRERRLRHDHSNPNSQSQSFSQNTEEAYDTEENMFLESAGENEDDDRVTVLTGGPRYVKCEEDEEFTSAFDKMMSENIQQRTIDASKVPQIDIAVPVTARNKPKKSYDMFKQENIEAPPVTMNFTLMTRSGKKQQYHEFEVPMSSELAANLRNREMAEMAEKQRMKELTLNINERQEEEDYAEMIASLQKPAMATPGVAPVVPRDRKPKFHHPKGAPDLEQIFHQTGNRKW